MPGNILESEFEWLVIILVYNNSYYDRDFKNMPGYVTMESQRNSLFRAIKDSVNSKEIKVILVETRFDNEKIFTKIIEKKGNGLKTVEESVSGDDHAAMVTKQSIENLLKIVLNQFKAKRHIIITFGHGSIFGINFTSTSMPGSDVSASILSNRELAGALKTVFKEKKVDVLVMYNCLMQNVNTQYDLRQVVDYLVAPLSGISHPGYNYHGVLNQLAENKKMDNKNVAGLFCDNLIVRSHKRYKSFETEIENTWYISSIKLDKKKYDDLKNRFAEFIDEILRLKLVNDQIFRCLKDTINQLFGYNRYCIPDAKVVDLGVFLIQLKRKAVNNPDVKAILPHIDGLIDLISTIDNEIFCGKGFYQRDKFFVDQEINVKKGFGFFIPKKPTRKLLFDKLFEGNVLPYTPGMWENTSYVKFIQQFQQWNGDFI